MYILFAVSFVVCNILILYFLQTESPFYNHIISIVWECSTIMSIWAGACLLLSLILNNTKVFSPSSIFIMVLPVIIIIAVFFQKTPESQLAKSEDFLNMLNPNETEVLGQITIFRSRLDERKISHSLTFLLSGYILKHVKCCKNKNCSVCKEDNLRSFIISITKSPQNSEKILEYLNILFKQAIETFPHFNIVKLHYLLFLIENMRNSSMAFSFAKKISQENSFSLWEEYELYKHIKMMTDTAKEKAMKEEDSGNIRKQIEFEKFKKRLYSATESYSRLWQFLNYQQSTASGIEEIIIRILNIKKKIKEQATFFTLNGFKNLELKYLYAEFVGSVLGDFQRSHKLKLECLQEMSSSALNLENTDQLSILQSKAILDIFADEKKFGVVRDCNMGFCQLYKEQKSRIVGMRIDEFIPVFLQKKHREEMFSATSRDQQLNRTLFKLIINASGYLSPIEMRIHRISEITGDPHFFCSIWQRKIHKQIPGYILFDSNFVLRNISNYCEILLGLNQSMISSGQFKLNDLFPSLTMETAKENMKKTILVNFKIPNLALNYFKDNNPIRFALFEKGKVIHCSIIIYEMKFGSTSTAYYFSLREDTLIKRVDKSRILPTGELKSKIPISVTQFFYCEQFGKFEHRLVPNSTIQGKIEWSNSSISQKSKELNSGFTKQNEDIILGIETYLHSYSNLREWTFTMWLGQKVLSIYDDLKKNDKLEMVDLLKRKYFAHHIKLIETVITKRINNNTDSPDPIPVRSIPGIAENANNLLYINEEEFTQKRTTQKASVIDQDYRVHQALLSDEDLINQIYEKSNGSKYFFYFFFYFLGTILLHIGVGYFLFRNIFYKVDFVKLSGSKAVQSSRRFSEIMDFEISLLALISINKGKMVNFRNRTKDEYITFVRKRMNKVAEAISNDTTDQYVELTKISMEEFDIYRQQSITFYGEYGIGYSANFQQILLAMNTVFFKILDMNTEKINMENDIILLNMGNNQLILQNALIDDTLISTELIKKSIDETANSVNIFAIFISSVLVLFPLGISVAFCWMHKQRIRRLNLFLSVSSRQIQEQIDIAQSSLNTLAGYKVADIDVEELEKEGKLLEQQTQLSNADMKQHKNRSQSFTFSFLEILLAILFIISISLWQSIASTIHLICSHNMLMEFRKAHTEISVIGSTMGRIYITYFRLILSYKDASQQNYTLAQSSFSSVKNCITNWEISHSAEDTRQFKEYNTQYNQITKSDLCPYLPLSGFVYYQEEISSCNNSAAGIGGIGLFPVITYILDSLREYLGKLGQAFEQYSNSTELELALQQKMNEYALQDIYDYTNQFARPIYYYFNQKILGIIEENAYYWENWANDCYSLEIFITVILVIFISYVIFREYSQYKKNLESISVFPVQIRIQNQILIDYVKSILSNI